MPNTVEVVEHLTRGRAIPHKERRKSPRISVSKRAVFLRAGSLVEIPITIIEVSASGLRFIYSTALADNIQFILRLKGGGGEEIAATCLVRWSDLTGSGRFRIGAEFIAVTNSQNEPR